MDTMFKKLRRVHNFKHRNRNGNMNKLYWLKEDDCSEDDQIQLDSEWGGLLDNIEVVMKEEQKKQDLLDGTTQSGGGGGGGGGEKKPTEPAA
jgi:hypothetical protein